MKTCFKTIGIYTGNVVKNPTEDKFKTINMANEAFQKRVGKISGGKIILKAFGFEENLDENKMVLKEYNADLFAKGIDLINDAQR